MIIKPPTNQKPKSSSDFIAKPIITCRGITKAFGEGENRFLALRGLDVDIYETEFVIIFGPSGSGKSTLLNIIAGLDEPTTGTIQIDEENPYQYDDRQKAKFHRQKVGMVFQSYNLIPTLTIVQNITLPLAFDGMAKKEREEKAVELLKRFDLLAVKDRLPSELSGGQQQRIGVIRALINTPPIIIADEPTGNLDSVASENVMKLFKELNITFDTTMVVVTHDPSQFMWADRVIHVLDGRVIKQTVYSRKSLAVEASNDYPIEYAGEAKRILEEAIDKDIKENEPLHRDKPIKRPKKKHREPGKNVFNIVWTHKDQLDNQTQKILSFMRIALSRGQLEKFSSEELERTINAIELRLNEDIKKNELEQLLDLPLKEGGAGLYKQTAKSLAETLEKVIKLR